MPPLIMRLMRPAISPLQPGWPGGALIVAGAASEPSGQCSSVRGGTLPDRCRPGPSVAVSVSVSAAATPAICISHLESEHPACRHVVSSHRHHR